MKVFVVDGGIRTPTIFDSSVTTGPPTELPTSPSSENTESE